MTDLRRVPPPIGGWILIERSGTLEYISDAGESQPLLTGSDLTDLETGFSEQGLLGLAVDPLYPNAGSPNTVRLYVNYTGDCNPCKTFVSRFVLTQDTEGVFSVSSEEVLLRVRQPAANHNGGALVFGTDNMLYISIGDGGSGNDPWCSGQNPWSPLGKVFRIDVHSVASGTRSRRTTHGTPIRRREHRVSDATRTLGAPSAPASPTRAETHRAPRPSRWACATRFA